MCLYMHTKPAIPPQKYNKLLKDNITKSYKKLTDLLRDSNQFGGKKHR